MNTLSLDEWAVADEASACLYYLPSIKNSDQAQAGWSLCYSQKTTMVLKSGTVNLPWIQEKILKDSVT